MKSILILLLLCAPLVIGAYVQDKLDGDWLALKPAELKRLAAIVEADQLQTAKRAHANTANAELDNLLVRPDWNGKLAAFVTTQRRSNLLLLTALDKEAAQLKTDFEAWQAEVRKRANCADCEFDLQQRRLVKPNKQQ